MPDFSSTTLNEEMVRSFLNQEGDRTAIMKISIVEASEEFNFPIANLGFPGENGIFFPTDISAHSCFPAEKEVLFPPLYPIRIVEVDMKQKPYVITAQTPCCVNVIGKDDASTVKKCYSSEDIWNKSYLNSVLKFAGEKIIDKISLSKLCNK